MPAEPALDGRIGCAVWLVILKGLDRNSIFLQIFNLYTIKFHVLAYLSWLQFARVLILLWAPVALGAKAFKPSLHFPFVIFCHLQIVQSEKTI